MTVRARLLAPLLRWLLGSRIEVSPAIQKQLEAGLFSSLPIFMGGVLNSIAIAAIAAWRHPTAPFLIWLGCEVALALIRLPVIAWGRAAQRQDREPPVAAAALLACAWSAAVGFGAFISIRTEDWVLATIVCLSAAAMVCGICLRNFGTPRLAAVMVFLSLAPCAAAGLLTSETLLTAISGQLPIFMLTIFVSAFGLHRLMVSRMNALTDLERSEGFNRSILESSPDYTLLVDRAGTVVFGNGPDGTTSVGDALYGRHWFDLLHPDDRQAGEKALAIAASGKRASLTTRHVGGDSGVRWFDVIVSPMLDGTGRMLLVARNITHQKTSEAHAVWMARHDALTGLGNRAVLQHELDARIVSSAWGKGSALLVVDVDHFKTINDTLGHDAGDALLCEVASRLRASTNPCDLVTRTGGDEFAILISATTLTAVEETAAAILARMREPFIHQGRLLECGVSIGASVLLKDGQTRSEVMKAADIALYAAKSAGRARLKIFDHHMKVEVDRQQSMISAARKALNLERIVPYYQPKVRLRSSEVVGFEALLRWTDDYGSVRMPEDLNAAFADTRLAADLSKRMIDSVLDQMRAWTDAGIRFGHVAINVTPTDFRHPGFADNLLGALAERELAPSLLQLEVTETAFLGRTAEHVEAALRHLSAHGVRIALDDFGTGYASLSHLKQFPVDLLKIDQVFVRELCRDAEAEAITAAVINLGHCLGMEIVAEGVETSTQEARLHQLGCDTAQGFKYAHPLPGQDVPSALSEWRVAA